jgi:hypothetical protein
MLTAYHAKYFAHEPIKRCPSDSIEKLASTLVDAQVDLNPHQIEAPFAAISQSAMQNSSRQKPTNWMPGPTT